MQQIRDYLFSDLRTNKIYPTLAHIAEEMVNALPADLWNDPTLPKKRFLDICCKSGIFLIKLRDKLMTAPAMVKAKPDEKERLKYILEDMLYGIAPCKLCEDISRIELYSKVYEHGNIVTIADTYIEYTEVFKLKNAENKLKYLVNNKFSKPGGNKIVTFDVVVGNPPYNGGMDLDFVNMGYKLTNENTGKVCMITPAKWQTASADQKTTSNLTYGAFRSQYILHMSHICFYPDCKDLFDIMQADGISWYLISHEEVEKCTVENKLKANPIIDSIVDRNMKCSKTLFNIGDEIMNYLGDYNKFKFSNNTNRRFRVLTNNHAPGGALYAFSKTAKHINVIGKSYILDTQTGKLGYGEDNLPDDATEVFSSDNVSECVSFISWLNTKFVRFFVAINISKLAPMMCNECFALVPAPELNDKLEYKFDHIYTDSELYKKFNIPQKYIDVIESVIKARKPLTKSTSKEQKKVDDSTVVAAYVNKIKDNL